MLRSTTQSFLDFLSRTFITQQWLIQRMETLNYKVDRKGICYGYSAMGVQAILAQNVGLFKKRLDKINEIPVKNFSQVKDMDILAFFDGLIVNQQWAYYAKRLDRKKNVGIQLDERSFLITQPKLLEKSDGVIKICRFTGVYSEDELKSYFTTLQTVTEKFPAPIALFLHSNHHAISIGFDFFFKKWIIVDANHAISAIDTPASLAKVLIRNFQQAPIFLSTKIYASKENEYIKNKIREWQQTEVMIAINKVTEQKAKLLTKDNYSWLSLAIVSGELKTVHELLQFADPNNCFDNGYSDFALAVQRGRYKMVEAMLKRGANPNLFPSGKHSLLDIAIGNNFPSIVKLLLEYNADCEKTFFPDIFLQRNPDISQMVRTIIDTKSRMRVKPR